MKIKNLKQTVLIATAPLALALGSVTCSAQDASAVWQDPEFVNSFLGSYGFLPDVEPGITEEEIELLRDLIALIEVSPKNAAARLATEINESSSGAMTMVLGNLYLQSGDFVSAIDAYSAAIKKFPNFLRAHKNLALAYLQQERYKDAVDSFAKALALGDKDAKTYGRIGYCNLQLDNLLAAEEGFRQALVLEPDNKDWKQGLADCLLKMNQYREAESLFGHLISEDPDDPTFWRFQANTYSFQEDPLKTAVNLQIVKDMGKAETQDLILLGDIYLKHLKMFDEALNVYTAAIRKERTPEIYGAVFSSVKIFNYFGEYKKSKALIGLLQKSYKDSISEKDELELLVATAKIARAEGNDEEAAKTLESIVTRDPLNGSALLELAKYYGEESMFEKAEYKLEQAKNIEGFEHKALVQYSQLLVKQKKYKQAIPLLHDALKIKQDPRIQKYLERVERASKTTL